MILRKPAAWAALASATLLACPAWAFEPGIHEDISAERLRDISRSVDGEELKFRPKAIVEIRKANSDTDLSTDFFRAFKHFDGELFGAASNHLMSMRQSVISAITAGDPDGEKARKDLGTALHTLQDFYAHSNWVETGQGSFNNALGRNALANPPLTTAFCPGNPERLGGAGLTQTTTGYYQGLLGCGGSPPAGKCWHGGPGGCDGINKDKPGRTGHGAARGFASQGTEDYLNQILDASGVAGNAKAIKALMRINGTLGMVIDDTGSMGGVINQVKAQVAQIVASVAGTAKEPDEYLLVRFGDPDVGPPFTTTNASAFLGRVNSLFASGGGDCPELSQTALLQAIGASRKDSQLYLFTDASAKDAGLAGAVSAAAQAKRIKITGAAGSCSPIDPAYVRNTEETGGQLFFLSSATAASLFDLIRPQLSGDFVTIARVSSTLVNQTRTLVAPVDSTVSRAVFSVALDISQSVVLRRPSGVPVQAGDPGVTIRTLVGGTIITVENPEVGDWALAATGSGGLSMAVQANSPLELFIFEFVERVNPVHTGYAAISGQPVVGTTPLGLANLIGPFGSVAFRLVDQAGNDLGPANLLAGDSDAAADEFVGTLTLPAVPFRVAAHGVDTAGNRFERLFSTLFRAQTVQVTLDPATAPDSLPVGTTTTLRFIVKNVGPDATFRNLAVDNRGFVRAVSPTLLTLPSGGSGTFDVTVTVPAGTPEDLDVQITATSTKTTDALVTNSSSLTRTTGETNQPPDCGSPAPTDLWPPNHRLVSFDIAALAGASDPDGDPVTLVVSAITQDEPVQGPGSGNTAPDGTGVGSATAQVRAERAGGGNGRVYAISYTGDDGRGGACSGVLNVRVPHSRNGDPAVDDGQLFDSTQP